MDTVRKLTPDERQLVYAAVAVLESDIDKAVRDSLRRWAARLLAAYVVLLALALTLSGVIFQRVSQNTSATRATRAAVERENRDKRALEAATRTVAFRSCVHQNEHRAVERRILQRSEVTSRTLLVSLHVTPAQIEKTQRQTQGFIHDLADVNCNAQAKTIPVG